MSSLRAVSLGCSRGHAYVGTVSSVWPSRNSQALLGSQYGGAHCGHHSQDRIVAGSGHSAARASVGLTVSADFADVHTLNTRPHISEQAIGSSALWAVPCRLDRLLDLSVESPRALSSFYSHLSIDATDLTRKNCRELPTDENDRTFLAVQSTRERDHGLCSARAGPDRRTGNKTDLGGQPFQRAARSFLERFPSNLKDKAPRVIEGLDGSGSRAPTAPRQSAHSGRVFGFDIG